MRSFLQATDRLCAVMLLGTTAACGLAEEVTAERNVESAPGYGDAPVASDAAARPELDWSKLGDFGKAAAVLDKEIEAPARNLEKSYLSRFQQLVRVERSFILRACQLDEKQKRRISEVTDVCAKVAARRYALARASRLQVQGNRKVVRPPTPEQLATVQKDLREGVRRLLLLAVDELLSPEQKQRYAEETQRRKDYLKRTTILNLVDQINEQLMLTTRQRELLVESLTKNWDPSWAESISHLTNSTFRYLPRIDDKYVVGLLSGRQKARWQNIQKVTFSTSHRFGIGRTPQVIIDEQFGPEEPKAVPPAVPEPVLLNGGGMF